MCDRNETLQRWLRLRTLHLWFGATIDSKRQSAVERGISRERGGARFAYIIHDPGFSTNWLCPCQWREKKRRRKGTLARNKGAVWLMSRFPTTQTMFVPSSIGFDPRWSCFLFPLSALLFTFLFFAASLNGQKFWLKTKASGKHLDPCA